MLKKKDNNNNVCTEKSVLPLVFHCQQEDREEPGNQLTTLVAEAGV